jgi:hypothetical protein
LVRSLLQVRATTTEEITGHGRSNNSM